MATFNQVVKIQNSDVPKDIFPSQNTIIEVPVSVKPSLTDDVITRSVDDVSPLSPTKELPSISLDENVQNFKSFSENKNLSIKSLPSVSTTTTNEYIKETCFRASISSKYKARIRTIEELLDSSSDLDLPVIEPPTLPVLETPEEMSADHSFFSANDINNGASKDFGNKNLPNQCMPSTSTYENKSRNANDEDNRPLSISPTPTTGTVVSVTGGISINHYERLIEELKCPGCAYPMKAPIKLCATGHSICQNCTMVLIQCPLCMQPFIDMRSLTLEALCSKAHFRCSNAAAGCAVRLQIDLLNWHEKQCIWKSMKCFMGRVWGDCQWTGREANWKDHLETVHADRVFKTSEVDLIWNMNGKIQSLSGYYVFEIYDEMFNFYQVYDRDRILFTMTVTSTVRERKLSFAYEVEMYHKDNEALVITQRFPVHSEYDKDILLEGTCVTVALTDLARFIGQEKLLYFRVRLHEIKSPKKSKLQKKASRKHPIDFKQTNIEGANLKSVPVGVIVTRQPEEAANDDTNETDDDSSFTDDPEFDAYIEKNWGTPQLNFNRKYWKNNVSKEGSTSSGSSNVSTIDDGRVNGSQKLTCEASGTKNKMRNVTSSLRKSLRSLRTDIIDLKKPFTKSPEKKETLIKK